MNKAITYDEAIFWRTIARSYSEAELKKICSAPEPREEPSEPGDWRSTLAGFCLIWLSALALVAVCHRIWGRG